MSLARIKDTSYDKSCVYEPSEDSFLLADAVVDEIWKKETSNARRRLSSSMRRRRRRDSEDKSERDDDDDDAFVSVEIGVGSGYVLCSHAMSFLEQQRVREEEEESLKRNNNNNNNNNNNEDEESECQRKDEWRFIGVDVNEKAVEHAKETMRGHGLRVVGDDDDDDDDNVARGGGEASTSSSKTCSIEIFRGDMLEDDRFYHRDNDDDDGENDKETRRRKKKPIDVLLFNPPYVVTPSEEIYDPSLSSDGTTASKPPPPINAAWAGGVRGREVVDRILYDVKSWLRPNGGTFLVVAYAQNDVEEMMSILRRQEGLLVEKAKWTQADEESLVVLKAVRI
jgi:methylase of polypeptide subunit release factors